MERHRSSDLLNILVLKRVCLTWPRLTGVQWWHARVLKTRRDCVLRIVFQFV